MLVLFINCLILSYGEKIIYHNNHRKFLIHRVSSTSIESIFVPLKICRLRDAAENGFQTLFYTKNCAI